MQGFNLYNDDETPYTGSEYSFDIVTSEVVLNTAFLSMNTIKVKAFTSCTTEAIVKLIICGNEQIYLIDPSKSKLSLKY